MHLALGKAALTKYQSEIEERSMHLVERLCNNPTDLWTDIQIWAEAILENVAYGTDDHVDSSGFCEIARAAMEVFKLYTSPFIVWPTDILPPLRHLPSWLPGMGFKRQAEKFRHGVVKDLIEKPFNMSLRKMAMGRVSPCLVSELISEWQSPQSIDAYSMGIIQNAAMSVYLGGFESLASLTMSFYLAMALHPQEQQRAQSELDNLLQGSRLPTLDDRSALPIVDCIMKEVIRWATPTPLIFPHLQDSEQDASVNGYSIPRQSVIIVNASGIFEDPEIYPDPLAFIPERHLQDGVLDPCSVAFGYGRRQCPGVLFVEHVMWNIVATTLATMNVHSNKAINDSSLHSLFTQGVMRHPHPFEVTFKKRDVVSSDV